MKTKINSEKAGNISNNQVYRYILTNDFGLHVSVLNFGGIIEKLIIPDREGEETDIVLGYKDVGLYEFNPRYYGGIIGRFANRISNATFDLGDKTYILAANLGQHHLHGGMRGFIKHFWNVEILENGIRLDRVSPHMEEGFPGALHVTVDYVLQESELQIHYAAKTNKTTIVNLTNHCYFNLNGEGRNTIENHFIKIESDQILSLNADLIPTGNYLNVAHTSFDFNNASTLLERLNKLSHPQLRVANGYDHTFVLQEDANLKLATTAYSPSTGIELKVLTTEPGVQFYCGDFTGKKEISKSGSEYAGRAAFCLETQHFPDSPNQLHFPSTILHPDQEFQSKTIYRFNVRPK